MHSELCPVCKGSGVIQQYPINDSTNGQPSVKLCHACNGRGYLYVPDASDYYPPYQPYPPSDGNTPWTITWTCYIDNIKYIWKYNEQNKSWYVQCTP
jgi:hypothetical protein